MKRYLPALALGAVLSYCAWQQRYPHAYLSACAKACIGRGLVVSRDGACRCLDGGE
jgi:hypothetical protein